MRGWRRVSNRESRKRHDWTHEVKQLLMVDYPKPELVTLVCDNLNTHDIASLYATFDAETAHRLTRRLRIIHTPRNGRWLNMAEMELGILSRQCLNRRFDSFDAMGQAIDAWQKTRNRKTLGATWRFTTTEARVKLKGLYPLADK